MQVRFGAVALALALTLPSSSASAQTGFFASMSGAPASIDCTSTGAALNGGNVMFNWNLPASNLAGAEDLFVNNVLVFSTSGTLPASSGSLSFIGPTPPFGPVAFPYTVKLEIAPAAPGVSPASFTFRCPAAGPGTDFRIQGVASSAPVPATSLSVLALLAVLIAATTLLLRRRV